MIARQLFHARGVVLHLVLAFTATEYTDLSSGFGLAGPEDQKYNQGMLLLRSSCSTRDSRSGGGARPTQGHDHSVVLFFF
jgi:hypothetical protein